MKKQTYIVLDTNFLYQSAGTKDAFKTYNMNANYLSLKREILYNNPDFCVLIPEMVCRELAAQKYEDYIKSCEKCAVEAERLGIGIQLPLFSRAAFESQIYERIKKENINLIPLCSDENLKSIIQDAIEKKPPFEGKDGKSDKGFKDAVIWYSVLEFAINHDGDYFFVSDDKIFFQNKDKLNSVFENKVGGKSILHFVDKYSDIQIYLKKFPRNRENTVLKYEMDTRSCRYTNGKYCPLQVTYQYLRFIEQPLLQKEIEQIYEGFFENWQEWSSGFIGDEYFNLCEDSIEVSVEYNQNEIVSILFQGDVYTGGPHGSPYRKVLSYDTHLRKRIFLQDIFKGSPEEIYQLINQKTIEYEKTILKEDFLYKEYGISYSSLNEVSFYLTNQAVVVYFDVYEIAAYYYGYPKFTIPYVESGIFRKDFLDMIGYEKEIT